MPKSAPVDATAQGMRHIASQQLVHGQIVLELDTSSPHAAAVVVTAQGMRHTASQKLGTIKFRLQPLTQSALLLLLQLRRACAT
jgi:hypothetical protein